MKTLSVKQDGKITVPTFNGTKECMAVVDASGNRYVLLTFKGQTLAWDCNTEHDPVDCVLVNEFAKPVNPVDKAREAYTLAVQAFEQDRSTANWKAVRVAADKFDAAVHSELNGK